MMKYQNIINLQLLHEYYAGGQCRLFNIEPDVKTQQWMQQMGWRFVQRDNVGQLLAPSSVDLKQMIKDNPDLELSFQGTSADPQFIYFTEGISLDERGLLVFTNPSAATDTDSSTTLTSGFQADTEKHTTAIARIQLRLDKLTFKPEDWPIHYQASFKARAVAWKYFIVNGSDNKQYTLSMKGAKADLFTGPSQEQLPNTTAAQIFDSTPSLIPFSEDSKVNLSLLGKPSGEASGNETVLLEHLPTASPSSLKISDADGQQAIYSPIYVYL